MNFDPLRFSTSVETWGPNESSNDAHRDQRLSPKNTSRSFVPNRETVVGRAGALLGLAGSELLVRARLPLPGGRAVGGLSLIFIVPAVLGLVWCAAFLALVPSTHAPCKAKATPNSDEGSPPPGHPHDQQQQQQQERASAERGGGARPWRALFTERRCLAVYFNHFATAWLQYLMLTQLPTFAREFPARDEALDFFLLFSRVSRVTLRHALLRRL